MTAARRSRRCCDGQVDFTIGQDLAYQPYQALKLLFGALLTAGILLDKILC